MPARPSILSPQRLAFHTRPVVPRKRVAAVQRCLASDDASRGRRQTDEKAAVDERTVKKQMEQVPGQSGPTSTSMAASVTAADEHILAQYARGQPVPQERGVRFDGTRAEGLQYPDAGPGHKFPLLDTSALKITDHLRRRYDPVIDQVTKSIMRDGKLSVAQKNVSIILDYLRTAPAPHAGGAAYRPLLSDSMLNTEHTHTVPIPREQLPLSPIQYLTAAVDSVAPLVKIRQQKGMAGGGASTPIPIPLRVKQRRRTAIQWILQAAEARKETKLADRLAKEIIKVADGTSSAWEKRQQVHRLAVVARSNHPSLYPAVDARCSMLSPSRRIRWSARHVKKTDALSRRAGSSLSTLLPPNPPHTSLSTYLAHSRRHALSRTSPTFLGTRYEYIVSDALRRLGIDTVRVGKTGDRGVDLVGYWHLPSQQDTSQTAPIRVVVQCKRLAKKVTPSVVRELEGSFAAGGGPVGWGRVQKDAVMGVVVGTMPATRGVVEGLKRRIRQVLWNLRANALGLEGIDVVKRHYVTPHEQQTGDEVELHWRGRKVDALPSR
ncbi:hypothetical protein DV736_g2352, partial [Chaetothyriales sp. CBS 134916]